jgi:hypothetical protein
MANRLIRRTSTRCLVAAVSLLAWGSLGRAELIYESATTVSTGDTMNSIGGTQTDLEFYSGVRFLLDEAVMAEAIGGHFATPLAVGNGQIFGVIAALDDGLDVPDLDTDVIAQTLLTLPTPGFSDNVSGSVSALLQPGWYALVFGSGRYGATSDFASAIKTNGSGPVNDGIDVTFALRTSDNALFLQAPGARFFLEGRYGGASVIPEPGAALLTGLGLLGVGLARAARRRALDRG